MTSPMLIQVPICMATQQGGAEIRTDDKAPTITAAAGMSGNNQPVVCYPADQVIANAVDNAEMHGNVPCVMDALPFDTTQCTHPANYSNPKWGDPCHPLAAGAHAPAVVCCIDGDKIGKAERAGGSGFGIRPGDKMYTITAKDAGSHAVAFQTYQKVTGPLMANSHPGSYTGQDAFSDMLVAGVDCRNATEYPEKNGTLQAKPGSGTSINYNQVVRVRYIVRRLTPTECARLQGFADRWAVPDHKDELTDEEYAFWCKVNLDYDRVFGKARPNKDGWYNVWREVKPNQAKDDDFEPYWEDTGKPYTHKKPAQMLKWYNNLRTDSSEYKLWGNGIAFPNALYVMQGISDVINQ